MNAKALLLLAIGLLNGCAISPDNRLKQAELLRTVPTCSGVDECNAKWDAAQLWVVKNAGWKIQIQSNVLIETYNPIGSSPNIAVRVTKEPLGGGKYRFIIKTWCANLFGCVPDAFDAALQFNREIARVQP